MWDQFFVVTNLLKDSGLHFLFSGLAGLLEFLLILTISSAAYRLWRGTASPNIRVRYSILGLALVCAFLAAWSAHCYMDYYGQVAAQIVQHNATGEMIEVVPMPDWWYQPINEPLHINTDPNRYSP